MQKVSALHFISLKTSLLSEMQPKKRALINSLDVHQRKLKEIELPAKNRFTADQINGKIMIIF